MSEPDYTGDLDTSAGTLEQEAPQPTDTDQPTPVLGAFAGTGAAALHGVEQAGLYGESALLGLSGQLRPEQVSGGLPGERPIGEPEAGAWSEDDERRVQAEMQAQTDQTAARLRATAKGLAPDPYTTGSAANAIQGLTRFATEVAAGSTFAGPAGAFALAGGVSGHESYYDWLDQGVDPKTARMMAVADGTVAGMFALIPGAGELLDPAASLLSRIGVGAGAGVLSNVPLGMLNRWADHGILEQAGYPQLAEQQKAWDGMAILMDTAMGVIPAPIHALTVEGFGHVLSIAKRSLATDSRMQDARDTFNAGKEISDRAPGVPVDAASYNAHQDALEQTTAALLAGEHADLGEHPVTDGTTFAARGQDAGQHDELLQLFAEHLGADGGEQLRGLESDTDALLKRAGLEVPEREAAEQPAPERSEAEQERIEEQNEPEPALKGVETRHRQFGPNNEGHIVESANGYTEATEDGHGNLHVRWTLTDQEGRGRGEGTARMEHLLQIARERGVKVFSDSAVSKLQQGVYKRLEEHGYKVKQHKDAVVNPDAGGLVTNDPRKPVFTIDQRERPARPTTGAGRGQKATPDAKTQSVVEFLANDPKGIDREDAEREGFDPADMKKATHGILKAFRRGGRSMDSVAELLSQHGFDVLDRDGNYSAEKAKELIDQDMRAMIAGTKAGRRYSHLNEDERQRELNRLEDERRERGLEILKADGETPEDARIIVETSEMTDEQARMFLGRHAATEETEDEREQRVEREAIRDEASDANHAEYAKPPEGETGEPADEGAGPNAEELRLEAESEYERREREDAQAAAEHAERAAIQSAEERRRADVEAKDFKLTGSESASDANPDQSDIFGMVAKDADEKGKPAPFVDGNGVERDAGVADEQLGSLEDQAKAEAEKAMNAANGCAQRGGT